MKPRKFEKKLALSKQTIADLKSVEMKEVQGGKTVFPSCNGCPDTQTPTCPTWFITLCYPELC